jgi:hypothetical protein
VFYDHVLEAFATAIDVKHVQDWGVGLGCRYEPGVHALPEARKQAWVGLRAVF